MRAREVSVARQTLRQQLQRLLPQQQQDLGLLVPALKAGDRAGFRAHLTRMVHNGGNARIKRCLEGLSVAGFDATEIQAWLQSASAPVPQSNILKTRAEKAEVKAKHALPVQKQQERVTVEENKRSAPEQAKAKLQSQPAEQKKHQTTAPSKSHPSLKSQPGSSKTGFASEQKATAVKREEVPEKSQHAKKEKGHQLSTNFLKRLAAGKKQQDQKKASDMQHVGKTTETKERKPVGTHGSLRKQTGADEGMTRVAKKDHESLKQLANQAKEVEEAKQLAKEKHEEVKELVKRAQAEVVTDAVASKEKVHAETPRRPEQTKNLRQREAQSQQAKQHADVAATAERQHIAGAEGKVHENLKTVNNDKQRADKEKKKAALRRELSKRLAKGVQALSRVESLEKEEAGLKSTMSASEARMSKLEDALAKEIEARKKAEKENEDLRAEVLEEEKKSKVEAARLEAVEKHELDVPKDDSASRIEALEEENGKFRSALAGAARRLINIESLVAGDKTGKVKVIRHEKRPGAPAL